MIQLQLSDDDKRMLAYFVAQQKKAHELADVPVQSVGVYLCEKYQIRPPDQLLADGTIVRAAVKDKAS